MGDMLDLINQKKRIIELHLPPILYFLLALFVLLLGIFYPYHNWDKIAYVAIAKSYEEEDIKIVHTFTYKQIESSVSASIWEGLTGSKVDNVDKEYRTIVYSDPQAFAEQLSFYQIRPAYPILIFLLHKIGIPIVFAAQLVSGIAVFIGILVLYIICKEYLHQPFVYLMLPLAVLFGVFDLARYSTPNGLGFCALLMVTYLYLSERLTLVTILMPFLVLIQPDLILFLIPLYILIYFNPNCSKWPIVVSTFVSISIYIWITSHSSYPGWSVLIYTALVHLLPYPISSPQHLSIGNYLHLVTEGIKNLYANKSFILFCVFVIWIFFQIRMKIKAISLKSLITSKQVVLVIVSIIYITSHFFLYPAMRERYFVANYIVTSFTLFYFLSQSNIFISKSIPPEEYSKTQLHSQ